MGKPGGGGVGGGGFGFAADAEAIVVNETIPMKQPFRVVKNLFGTILIGRKSK
jgi:hypothetical protein